MTSYSGSFWLSFSGGISGGGWFNASLTSSLTLQDMILGGGMLSGTLYGGGTLNITGYSDTEGTISDSVGINFGPTPFSAPLDQFNLQLSQTVPEFGFSWTETNSFDALVRAEEELGPLFALVERAGEGQLRLSEIAALFWHCLADRADLTREAVGDSVVAMGLAEAAKPLRVLLGEILRGRQ